MKRFAISVVILIFLKGAAVAWAQPAGDYVERFDTLYNGITIERRGTVVEMRARSRAGEHIESAVDLAQPLNLVVPYTRSLYAALFLQPKPQRVLMIGLGGAGFHRLFATTFPDTLLQTVELDPKVLELARTRMAFEPNANTPVAILDGRQFVKRDAGKWDWLILDAFRGGYVPPHLKTAEFYRECAAHLSEHGVFVSNLHSGTQLYYADLKTISSVFPQVLLFNTRGRGNVIALAVKYSSPSIADPAAWPEAPGLAALFRDRLDLTAIRDERVAFPRESVERAQVMTDDFSPVEFLDTIKTNNTRPDP